jgi:hypothetical protein
MANNDSARSNKKKRSLPESKLFEELVLLEEEVDRSIEQRAAEMSELLYGTSCVRVQLIFHHTH